MTGNIYGTPGGSLNESSSSWASSKGAADYGKLGEVRLGEAINRIVQDSKGAAVFHDVDDPFGSPANIDHIVIAGNSALVLDAKVWKRGFYYRLGSMAYRGMFKKFPSAGLEKISKLNQRIDEIGRRGRIDIAGRALVVYPSSAFSREHDERRPQTWALRLPGLPVVGEDRALRSVRKFVRRGGVAEPEAVRKIMRLVR